MMICKCDFEKANFGGPLFCRKCGMDIGLNPVRVSKKGFNQIYCCMGCIE